MQVVAVWEEGGRRDVCVKVGDPGTDTEQQAWGGGVCKGPEAEQVLRLFKE